MPVMRPPKTNEERRYRRHLRVRKKVSGTAERPRLVIRRSLKHIYAQLVDDTSSRTLRTVSSHDIEGKKTEQSTEGGKRSGPRRSASGSQCGRRKPASPASGSIELDIAIMAA